MRTPLALAALMFLAACEANPSSPLPQSQLLDPNALNLTLAVRGRGELLHTADVSGAASCSTLAPNPDSMNCVRSYALNASVTLDPKPAAGFVFDHFSGVCAGKVPCTLTVNERRTIEVIFKASLAPPPPPPPPAATSYTLTVLVRGKGAVKHTADAGGAVSCGTSGTADRIDCVRTYPANSSIVLEPSAAAGFNFRGWGGACTIAGTGTCTLRANENRTLEVVFRQ